MLKKLLRRGLFCLLLSSLNASAEGVQIEIKTDRNGVRIEIETDSSDFKSYEGFTDLSPNPYRLESPGTVYFESRDRRKINEPSREIRPGVMEWVGPDCSGNPECEALCDAIYTGHRAEGRCKELSTVSVEKINKVVEVLKYSRPIELENMNLAAFELLLFVDYAPLEDIVDRHLPFRKKHFANWLATDSEATDIVVSAEDDSEILKALFGVNKDEFIANLNRHVSGPNNFIEVALDEGNEEALNWVHEYFENQCDPIENEDSKQSYEECAFKKYYCALSLDADFAEELFDYEFFEDTLDVVLEDHRPENAPEWWTEDIDAWDVNNQESHDVCKALGVGGAETKPQTGEAG